MEILFVSHKYPPAVGGMEKQSFELINGMKRFATVHSIVYTGQENRLFFFLSLEKKILEMCRRFPAISIVHFNDALIASFCIRHKSYMQLKRVVTVHGLDVVFPVKIHQKYILPAFNRFDLIIAVSQATKAACVERGIDTKKIAIINNGVDHSLINEEPDVHFPEFFKIKYGIELKGKIVLTALGRPVKRKGFSWFIRNVVPQLEGNYIFLIVGPFDKNRSWQDRIFNLIPTFIRSKIELFLGYPTDENQIRDLLLQKQFGKNVLHLGKLPFKELVQLLIATDAFIMPNIRIENDMEGFGLVCLEASLCGSWVFASQTDGITDAVHDKKNGTLILPESPAEWASELNNFIEKASGFKQRIDAAKIYTKNNFDWEKMASSYFALFHKLVK